LGLSGPLSTKPLKDWTVDLKMPECHCDGAPPPPPPFVENNTQAARNYTAFAPAKVEAGEEIVIGGADSVGVAALVRVAAGADRPVWLAARLWLARQSC
jgi:ABC-type transporter Mla subunit MlaD